jgi:hypothetical protein
LPGDVVRERIKNRPVIIKDRRVPGEPLAPRRGILSGRGLRTTCWRQGSGADGLPFICPFPSAIAEGRRLALPPDGRRHPRSGASHRSDGTVLDTRRPPRCRPGSLKELGRVPAQPHPRSPALNSVIEGSGILARGWRLRLWAPFFFVFLLSSSDFLFLPPFFCLPGELRALALPRGAPSAPPIRGSPATPASWGYGRAPLPAVPLRERGDGSFSVHHPSRGSSRRTRGSPGPLPPSSGRPRRGGAAPAFVGGPNSSPSAPRVSPWGLGNRDRQSWRPGLP